ncbi:g10694 [Coccomyxa elongata]
MVFPLHEETVSREEGRRLAKERYHKIHTLGLSLRARKNLNPAFEAMAGVASPMEPREIKVNKRKNYLPRRIVQDPGFCLDRFLVAASRWVLPKRLPSGRSGRGVRPTAVCVGASTAGGDTGLFSSIHSWGIFNEDLSSQMAPARLHAGIHRRRAAGLNADDDATP